MNYADGGLYIMNWVMLGVFLAILLVITIVGFAASGWRADDLNRLQEWGLGGRRFGTISSWFLIGGTFYTANAFIAVPGLAFGEGSQGFYNVSYQILVYPIVFVVLSRFWTLARHRGYITAADFVQERFGPTLALLVAVTGIVATMPYIALQIIGLQIAVSVLGLPVEVSLLVAFFALSAYTFVSGLRAPALIAIIKGVMIWLVIVAAFVYLPGRLGGFGTIFADAGRKAAQDPAEFHLTLSKAQMIAYPTTVLSSALAFLLYPHTLTVVLSARGDKVIRRNAILMSAFIILIALSGLLGFMAIAAGIQPSPVYKFNSVIFALFTSRMFPAWFSGFALAALTVSALVPVAIMSIGCANLFTRNIYRPYFRPNSTEREESNAAKIAAFLVKFGALIFILFLPTAFASNLQLAGGVWILQTLPAVFLGLYIRWFHAKALVVGWIGSIVLGTWMLASQHFSSVYPFVLGGSKVQVYTGLVALVVNILLTTLCTMLFRAIGVTERKDATTPADYKDEPIIPIPVIDTVPEIPSLAKRPQTGATISGYSAFSQAPIGNERL
jgi:SSS family solute:Na+ symporter